MAYGYSKRLIDHQRCISNSNTFSLNAHAPTRSIDNNAHQTSRHDTRHGESDEPAHVDPSNHAPVNSAPCARAETDTDSGTSDALSGGDGKLCDEVSVPGSNLKRNRHDLLRRVAMMMVTAEPNSIEKPREGE